MSGLTSALSNALSGLLVTSGQSAVVSRNVTRANDENYVRRQATVLTSSDGNTRLSSITRNSETKLLDAFLSATSIASGQQILLNSLGQLGTTVGDVEKDGSIGWGINQLQNAIKTYESDPSSDITARQAVSAASSLVNSLNDATKIVQELRSYADTEMGKSVEAINSYLTRIQTLDAAIVGGSSESEERVSAMDERDMVLKSLAAEIGIRTVARPDGGTAIYTESGVTLFDKTARQVAFNTSALLTASTSGQPVYADGVQILGASSPMPSTTGKLAAFAHVRDTVAKGYQGQLDEVARGLIQLFAETDQGSPATLPAATGLFSYSGSPTLPPSASITTGLAGDIRVNVSFDANFGGNPLLLRDGGANGTSYVYNTANVAGFQSRLTALISGFDSQQSFASPQLPGTTSIKGFATASAGWIEGNRSQASEKFDIGQATQTRTKDALMRSTGVNLDEEMATLLNLEKSYQASAKVLATVDQMLGDLMQIVR
jgi:flagellar hook-associated protein 1